MPKHGGKREGAGRPKTIMDPVEIRITIEGYQRDKLKAIAEAHKKTMSWALRRIIDSFNIEDIKGGKLR